jgi:ferredoxin-NADP reductase
MDREAGIAAYRALLTPEAYRAKLTRGETDGLAHRPRPPAGEQSPVLPVRLAAVEAMTPAITRYAFTTIDRKPLPRFTAGAHIDVVVAPEFFRQYSLAGDPADPGRYQIAVLREDQGKGGSALIHRIFRPGRRVFISRPINHFPLAEDAAFSLLLGGGIGVTPLIAMAHRLHALGRSFALHYAIRSRQSAGFLADLEAVPWKEEVHLYVSDEGGRADLDAVIGDFHPSAHLPDVQLRDVHLYVCGPDRLMQAARETAMRKGWPEAQVHVEYFAAPEQGERVDHPFKLALARTGRTLDVPAGRSATDVLAANGIPVVTKCSDGICGVCACRLLAGEVEHRDFVLGERERQGKIILCSSRAARPGAVIEVDL